jgi:hypothetical protein
MAGMALWLRATAGRALQHLDLGPKKGTLMALSLDSLRNLPDGRICWLLSLTGTLALLICLCYPDRSEGFNPSSETPRIKTRRSVVTPSSPAPTRRRGSVERGAGLRSYVRPAIPAQRRTLIRERQIWTGQPGEASKVTPTARSRKTQIQAPPQQFPSRKLAKPRVPYLTELALDIDWALVNLVLQQPAAVAAIYKNSLSAAKKAGDASKEREAATNLGHVSYLTGRFPDRLQATPKLWL